VAGTKGISLVLRLRNQAYDWSEPDHVTGGGPLDRSGRRGYCLPLQDRMPTLVGGGGEEKALCTLARYVDMRNWTDLPDLDPMRHEEG